MRQILGKEIPELIIMIGPSGSGKSTLAKDLKHPIVSTDTIRQNLFGLRDDKIDPEAYTQQGFSDTFAAAKFVVEGYLRAGQSVIYDATNLTKSDRRQFLLWLGLLDNTPLLERTRVSVVYCIVDRPLNDKINSYRARVKSGDPVYHTSEDIIQRHHDKMQTHQIDAVLGDGIPWITVWDYRK